MANPSTTLIFMALLWVSAAAAATKNELYSIENSNVGICKSLVEIQGYTCQEHKLFDEFQVTTEDGYILGLQRIPNGRSGNTTADKLPILLQHGLLLDASSWLLNPPEESLPFILADHGFDVWLSNARGTRSSRGHTSLSPNDPAYWEWSWDEMVVYDLPTSVQYVRDQTGQKLHYVGHSMGTLVVLAAFSEKKLFNLLRSAALLSPIAYLGQIPSLILRTAAETFLAEEVKLLGFPEVPNEQIIKLVQSICRSQGIDCSDLLAAIGEIALFICNLQAQIVASVIQVQSCGNNLKHNPNFSNKASELLRAGHWMKGTIEMYDYSHAYMNMVHYKKPTPPVYNMANIPKDIPLFLSYGGRDSISDVNDVGVLLDDLEDHDKDKLVVQYREDYAHLDFIMSVNANQLVYNPLEAFIRLH